MYTGSKYTAEPERPLASAPLASANQMLRLQVCVVMPGLDDAGDRTHGVVYGQIRVGSLPTELL